VAAEIRHFSEKKIPERHKIGVAILAFISTLLLLFL
jgi:cytochrome c1